MATPTALPTSFSPGDVFTAANANLLRGAFRVLQVVQGTYSTQVSNSTTTYADTGLTATITPSSSSSLVLVVINQSSVTKTAANAQNGTNIRLMRGATAVYQPGVDVGATFSALETNINVSGIYLDSPATTSATIYKTQFANRNASAEVVCQTRSGESTIILMEISA